MRYFGKIAFIVSAALVPTCAYYNLLIGIIALFIFLAIACMTTELEIDKEEKC